MDDNQFNELNGEIGKILGYYSFGAWTQLTPYLNENQDPNITVFHEGTHRDLCFYTTVGHLQLVLASLIRHNSKEHVVDFSRIIRNLNSSCWNTHEGTATFTSYLNIYPDFDSNIDTIRENLPQNYDYAFGIFLRAYVASKDIPMCKVSKSFALFNMACAAMSVLRPALSERNRSDLYQVRQKAGPAPSIRAIEAL
uniref:Uncharacterized protein n=1 Tax=Candidatus Kentrum sp. DK TaxID=2126562 RepID=A0A450TGZ2_9GAMM|nr:MAG: hypothetical protein BECKDK2373B_GA0170837_11701 [Candidatus Kentron sp. DK]